MKFDAEYIRQLKDRCRIEDVIARQLSLKRAGSNMVACCPFHNEKTPSFTVFPSSQSYYCFGCGEGGDVITYVMKTNGLTYPEAVKNLAQSCGLPIPAEDDPRVVERQRAKKRMAEMNLAAARYFRDMLFSPEGAEARKYVFEKRKLSEATVRRFGIGYAPDSWTATGDALKKAGFTENEIVNGFFSGRSKKNGKLYDYFKNRVMFPYFDINGNVIAFGGRVLDGGEPKYLNTRDTLVFKKGLNLYAMNFAKNSQDKTVLLCEGYMDVISLQQAGFSGAVASCGTALTSEQAQILSRYADRVVICYDSDKAGTLATQRAVGILGKLDLDVAVLNHDLMKGEKDPDDFIKKHGAAAFRALIDQSGSQTEYMISKIFAKYNQDMPEEKLKIIKEASAYIAGLETKVAKEVYSVKVAQKLGISEKTMLEEVEHESKKLGISARKKQNSDSIRDISRISDRLNPQAAKYLRGATAEDNILGILAAYPEMIEPSLAVLSEEDFITDFNRQIFARMAELSKSGLPDISMLSEFFDTSVMSRIYELRSSRMKLSHNDLQEIKAFAAVLSEEKKKAENPADMSDDDFLASIENMKNKKQ